MEDNTTHKTKKKPHPDYDKACRECTEPFVAYNLQQVFCCAHCKNRWNNRQKRYQLIAKKLAEEQAEQINQSAEQERKIAWNINQLEQLELDPKGKEVHLDIISRLKIDLNFYEGKYPIEGSPDSYYITLGNFRICWWGYDSLIIQKH